MQRVLGELGLPADDAAVGAAMAAMDADESGAVDQVRVVTFWTYYIHVIYIHISETRT